MNLYSNEAMLIGCALNSGDPDTLGDIEFREHPLIAAAIREGSPCDPATVLSRLVGNGSVQVRYGSSVGPTIFEMYKWATGATATAAVWRDRILVERKRDRLLGLGQELFRAASDLDMPDEALVNIALNISDSIREAL